MNLSRVASVFVYSQLVTTFAFAQVSEKKTLTLDGAKKVLAACEAEAKSKNTTGVIAVVDDGGNLIAVHRIDGTFAAGANISIGKARTAALFKKPTRVFEEIIKNGRTAMVALNDFTPLQGGVPIALDGQIVGAVGVSGAASATQDEEIAIAGANAISDPGMAAIPSPNRDVAYFDRKQVAAAFEKGQVLFPGGVSAHFAIHASRREQAGGAEVHSQESDLMYVQEGTATIVTGGTVIEPRDTAPDEIRGKAIMGGDERRLTKGDVIIIPPGVPHWFKTVNGTFTYYVVKVRA